MDTAPPFALYNPALLPPDVLLSEFTARRPLLARLLDIIRANDPGEPPQHVLCVGPRGMGKTTLLCAISATLKLHEPDLAQHWQPVIFDEESRRIGDLADFWLECIRQWESETEPSLTRSHRIDALLAKPGPDIEDQAREVFLQLVDASGKRALLLIDNLNDIFIALNDAESLMRLRSFLMSDPRVMIIGAATRWFSDVTGLDKPFFEFFRPFDLHALSLEEMRECLAGVATARGDQRVLDTLRDRPGSIEILHILTGGNPRLIRTFYRLLNEGMNGELRHQLERLIDDYTPYHKAIIDALPGQQQRVLDAIALEWNPCDVAAVSRITRLPSNQVSAQIKALIKSGLISEAANMGHSKKKAYLLTDRFSNIHYLMRHGRTGKTKMKWFVLTLRALFDDEKFVSLAANAVRMSYRGNMENDSLSIAQSVLECSGSETARRAFMDLITGSPEQDENVEPVLAEQVCRDAIARKPMDAYAHYKLGRLLAVHLKRYDEAADAYLKAIELDPSDARPLNNLGRLLTIRFGKHSEAEAVFRKAIKLNPNDAWPWHNLGFLLSEVFGKHSEAEEAYRKAIELEPEDPKLWDNMGKLLVVHLRKYGEAETAYRNAIRLEPDSATRWNRLGELLTDHLGKHYEAKEAYRKAIEINPTLAATYNDLGVLLADELGEYEEAKAAYLKAIELDPNDNSALNNLGNLWINFFLNAPESEVAYRRAIQIDPNDALVISNYGWLLSLDSERHEEAETYYRKAIHLDKSLAKARAGLGHLLSCTLPVSDEARNEVTSGLLLEPNDLFCQNVFEDTCFTHPESLRSVLPEVSQWCTRHPDDQSVLSFMVDAWIAYAKCASAKEARELLDAQPDEVKLAFETVRDAFLAHDDKDHLHRLAPERRAPVLKLLERLRNSPPGQ